VPNRFDRALRPHGHERWSLDDAVPSLELTEARGAVGAAHGEAKGRHVLKYSIEAVMKKMRVGVLYGGRSGEHEVSVASASSIFRHLDRDRYEAVPIRIEKTGQWTLGSKAPEALSAADAIGQRHVKALKTVEPSAAVASGGVDVVFPVLHGPYGEDGTVQGLLELANVPYVGSGVLGSAVGMDKAVMKTLFDAAGFPLVPHLTVVRREWLADRHVIAERAAKELRFPLFVKPANLGSSVGISKVASADGFTNAMELAFQFDRKAVIEASVPHIREIECAVLGNDDPVASVAGEIVVTHPDGFYSYDAKYIDADAASWSIPADLPAAIGERVRHLSVEAFRALDLAGMARVDFFLNAKNDALYINEVNTIPGFTTISMYPKLWEATGVTYSDLLDRLITLALERHAEKQALRTSLT
jgi:D-alanine-D-alanine ligase